MTAFPRNILVASDAPAFAHALREVLPSDAMVLSGVAGTAVELAALANDLNPDAVIIDPALHQDIVSATLGVVSALTPPPRVVLVRGPGEDTGESGNPRKINLDGVHVVGGFDELPEVLSDLVSGWRQAHTHFPAAPEPPDEAQRLQALHHYEILDSGPEAAFDALTRLAQDICGTSVALISMVDADRQWFKSRIGLDMAATERQTSFCQFAILERDVTIVNDATRDPRYATNPMVTGLPNIRFYAGAPLRTPSGHAIGTLCVIHHEPHSLADWQVRALQTLSAQVVSMLDLRLRLRQARRASEEQARLRRAIGEASRFYELLVDSIDGLVWECDSERLDCGYVSAGVEHLLGYSRAQWLKDPGYWRSAVREEDRAATLDAFKQVAAQGGEHEIEIRMQHRDGQPVWLRGRVQAIDELDRPRKLRALTVDITEAKLAQAALSELVAVDDLTGLPNRRGAREHLRATLAAAVRRGEKVAVMFLDLDRFKSINDTMGHSAGDTLIISIAQRLRASLRATDVVARLGGDEFLVVAAGIRGAEEAGQLARKIIAQVAKPAQIDARIIHPSCTVGISVFPEDGADMEALLRNADVAMYAAKRSGPGAFAFHDGPMQDQVRRSVDTELELHHAIGRDEFELHYQPQFDIRSGAVVGAEALIRWRHPARGLLLPGEFIPVSEETGQIHAIGAKVFEMACRQIGAWRDAGRAVPRIAINVSGAQLRNGLLSQISRELHNNRLTGEALDIEITETALALEPDVATGTLLPLRNLGARVTIDDFGVGYSSLLSIKQYPVQAVKVDRLFVAELPDNPSNAAIVGAIIAMAHSLSLLVIAEGVETDAALDALRRMGCDHFQGFVRTPALDANRFMEQYLPCR